MLRTDGYDIIGDLHGCADKLEGLLGTLGYQDQRGVYRHPDRTAVFVGDLIDRGPQQRRVLEIVRRMVEEGDALIAMGNHEFNAISYATEDPASPGKCLRPDTPKNSKQHAAFIEQVGSDAALYAATIEWFRTLPLWLELEGIGVVHACWNDDAIAAAQSFMAPGASIGTETLVRANRKGTPEHWAVEVLLKGPELSFTEHGQPPFKDKDDHPRSEARIRWWDREAETLRELAEIPPTATTMDGRPYPELPDVTCPDGDRYKYHGEQPVFFGHYWRHTPPSYRRDWTTKTACVDFSAVKGGPLAAYRWSGETEIIPENYM